MAGFIYCVDGVQAGLKAQAILSEAAPHLAGAKLTTSLSTGPDGKAGFLIVPEPPEGGERAKICVVKDAQEWQKSPCGKYWVGFDRKHRPTPADLAHPDQLDGHRVILGDGNTWLVPLARRYGDGGWQYVLDRVRKLGPDNKWIEGPVVGRAAPLWEHAERLQAVLQDKDDAEFDGQLEMEGAVATLAVNYRVGPLEVSMLGLLTATTTMEVGSALLDLPGLKELQKKVEVSDEATTSPGDEG